MQIAKGDKARLVFSDQAIRKLIRNNEFKLIWEIAEQKYLSEKWYARITEKNTKNKCIYNVNWHNKKSKKCF